MKPPPPATRTSTGLPTLVSLEVSDHVATRRSGLRVVPLGVGDAIREPTTAASGGYVTECNSMQTLPRRSRPDVLAADPLLVGYALPSGGHGISSRPPTFRTEPQ